MLLNRIIKFLSIVLFLTVFGVQGMTKVDESNKKLFEETLKKNNDNLFNKLIKKNKNIGSVYEDGRILMILALKNITLKQALFNTLLKYRTNPNIKDTRGETALMYAASNGNVDLVNYLLQIGADVNAIDDDRWSALAYAVGSGSLEIIKNLLDNDAKVNVIDNTGKTPLMRAAIKGQLDVVQLLVSRGADINLEDNQGYTASRHANVNDKDDVVEFLNKWKEITIKPELKEYIPTDVLQDIVIDYL